MKMKQLLGNALNLFMMVPFHLRNTICSNETAVRERLDTSDVNGSGWRIYSVSGGGIIPDYTVVVPVDESLD